MSDKTPAQKMRFKPGMTIALLHLPDGMREMLEFPAETVEVAPEQADFILDFAATQADAEERLTALAPLVDTKTLMWIAYPKGSKAAGHDISRDTIWEFGDTVGLVINANVAIDEVHSAVGMRAKRHGE